MNLGSTYLATGSKVIDKENEGTQMDSPIFPSIFTLHPFLLYFVAKENDITDTSTMLPCPQSSAGV